jgi:FkbM family methyltransferase
MTLGKNIVAISVHNRWGKLLRLPLTLIPKTAQVRILQGPLRGKKWIAGSGIHRCWLGLYEWPMQETFCRTIRKGDTIYDMGANVGFYSLLSSVLTGPTGKVFSFEPLPRNLTYLRKHIELNGLENCNVIPFAVSDTDGSSSFAVKGACMSSLSSNNSEESVIPVEMVALDTLVRTGKLPPPNVIKCDIEGAEDRALAGAKTVIQQHRPTLILATHGETVHKHCCQLLEGQMNYKLTSLDGSPVDKTSELLAQPRTEAK